jgi:hypothetical protein
MSRKKYFGYMCHGRFKIGLEHYYMTKASRERYFAKYKTQKGRKLH